MTAEDQAVTRRAGVVAIFTMMSRVLGFVRDAVIMSYFAGQGSDVFSVAFQIPNTLRRLTAEGALAIAYVPVFTSTLAREGRDAARRLMSAMNGAALIGLVVLTLAGMTAARYVALGGGYGFLATPGKLDQTITLLRYFFPYLLLISMTALAGSALNSCKRFFAPSFSPVLLNLAMIGSIVALAEPLYRRGVPSIFSTAPGVLLGGVLQLGLQLYYLKKERLLAWPSFHFRHPGVIQVLTLTGPMVLGLAAYQIMIYIASLFASLLPEGTATYLYNGSRLVELPQAVFGMAIATASLPTLSRLEAENDREGVKRIYMHSLSLALYITLAAAVAYIVLAKPIVVVLYQRGAFVPRMTQANAETLAAMALQIGAVTVVRQTVQVFYALKDTRTPVKASFAALVAYVIFALPMMYPLKHVGLALAMTLAATAQAVFLFIALRMRLGRLGIKKLLGRSVKWLVATTLMALTSWGVSFLGSWGEGGNSIRNIAVLLLAVAAGMAVFLASSRVLRIPELLDLKEAVLHRGKK